MIIIEGPDAAGKTTLIQQLLTHFNLPTIKSYKPRSRDDISHFHHWAAACPNTPILDRHPAISDLVYGPILRSSTHSSLPLATSTAASHYLVFCQPSILTLIPTLGNEPQLAGVEENISSIYNAYTELMEELSPNYIYDYTNPRSLPALITQLQHYLSKL